MGSSLSTPSGVSLCTVSLVFSMIAKESASSSAHFTSQTSFFFSMCTSSSSFPSSASSSKMYRLPVMSTMASLDDVQLTCRVWGLKRTVYCRSKPRCGRLNLRIAPDCFPTKTFVSEAQTEVMGSAAPSPL
eukprot:scaffold3722_cov263-Pinguiococcus_pyrenoidosus.AAC.3